MEKQPNAKLFRELSEPFPNMEAANVAVTAFLKELGELREKYKIATVLTVIHGSAMSVDGESESAFMLPHIYGQWLLMESLAAYAYGVATQERQEQIGAYLKGSLKKQKDDRP